MKNKKVLLVSAYNSTFSYPLKTAFEKNGYAVFLFDYRNILGNFKYFPLLTISLLPWVFLEIIKTRIFSRQHFLNIFLLIIALVLKPAYMFVVKGETITAETVTKINALRCVTFLWQVDPTFDTRIWNYVKKVGKKYTYYISCEPGRVLKRLSQLGFRTLYMFGAADKDKMFLSKKTKKYDISFVGTYHPIREKYLRALKSYDLHIWGWGQWGSSSVAQFFEGNALTQSEMLEVYEQSKIVVNVGRIAGSEVPTNLRPFEAAQVGAFILVDYKPRLRSVFVLKKELDTFRTPEELRRKVKYYLNQPTIRNKMAAALYKRVQKDHTYEKRIKDLMRQVL